MVKYGNDAKCPLDNELIAHSSAFKWQHPAPLNYWHWTTDVLERVFSRFGLNTIHKSRIKTTIK